MLATKKLKTIFSTQDGVFNAVIGISYSLQSGVSLGIIGESGCGKSVSVLFIMSLLPDPFLNTQLTFQQLLALITFLHCQIFLLNLYP